MQILDIYLIYFIFLLFVNFPKELSEAIKEIKWQQSPFYLVCQLSENILHFVLMTDLPSI